MKHYKVKWMRPGGGPYLPPDPVCGGGYHSDLHGFEIVYAPSAKEAHRVVAAAMYGAKVSSKVEVL